MSKQTWRRTRIRFCWGVGNFRIMRLRESTNFGLSIMYCGCFHCLRVYEATEVIDWIDDGETPLCPHCGVDAVMLGVTDLMELLTMRRTRFPHPLDHKPGSASDGSNDH